MGYNGGMTNSVRVGLLGGLLLAAPLLASAADFKTGDQPSFPSGETIADDLYMAGGSVTSSGTVTGDVVFAGGSIMINGPVSADVLAAGGSVTILSEIAGDVRAAGGHIVISGAVLGDVILGGGQINVSGPRIGGDVLMAGGTIRIDSPVAGDIKIGGGDVYLNSAVTGSVRIEADKVTLGPKAKIAGDFTYGSAKAATLESGAVVAGETTFNERKGSGAGKAAVVAFFSLWVLAKFLMTLVGAFAIGLLLHRFSREVVATAAPQPLMEIGRGAVVMIVLPIASVILLATVIGIPFGMLGLLSFIALMIFTSMLTPVVIGSIVHKWIWKPAGYVVDWKTILLGVAIYFLLGLIPFIGWIVVFGAMLLTLGAVVNIKWSALKEWR